MKQTTESKDNLDRLYQLKAAHKEVPFRKRDSINSQLSLLAQPRVKISHASK